MTKVLFVAAHRLNRSPSQRFRFEQYLSYLKQHGYDYDLSFLISERDDKVFYMPGNFLTKGYIFLKSYLRRLKDVWNSGNYDLIFIQREAFMTGSIFFEKCFARSRAKIIFDFDDAIWNLDVSEGNKYLHWLKNPGKTARIISLSHLVIAGNQYLADYARHHNDNVVIIPTTIDTDEYIPSAHQQSSVIVIGWSGSITTIKHFEMAYPFLLKLKEKYGEQIKFKVIGDSTYRNDQLEIEGIGWSKESEINELSTFDIGIMPLPDDEWAKGKCGLKGLQYMALKIPTIMSAVGVNTDIIQDGENGFLATETHEWVTKIERLIKDEVLRKQIGEKARQTVINRYSVHSQKDNYVKHFNSLLK